MSIINHVYLFAFINICISAPYKQARAVDVQDFLPPTIRVAPMDSLVEMSTKISFFCRADGNPAPTIIWKRNGKPTAQARYIVESLSNGLSTLRIEPVRDKENNSVVTCEASNEKGVVNASAKLLVWNTADLPKGFPTVIEDPRLKAVENNHSATMACSVAGAPTPRVLWLRNLMPLDMSIPRYNIATYGKPGSLVIQNSETSDEGKYECVARSSKGVAHSKSAHLYVKVRRVPPQFSIPPRRVYKVKSGGKVDINCVAYGHPMPRVFWHRASTNEDMEPPEQAPVGKNMLTLENVTKSDNYTCTAFSMLGNINAEVSVHVKSLPDPPDAFKVASVTSSAVSLAWSFTQSASHDEEGSEPRYQISYKRKYAEKYEFIDGDMTADTKISVGGLEPYTEYEFRVHAITDVGTGKASVSVGATTAEALPGSAPSNVKSRPVSNRQVIVQWEPPEKPNGRVLEYKLLYNYNDGEPYTNWPYKNVSEGANMAQLSDLVPDKLYTIRVQARNSVGFSALSDETLVFTKAGVPGQPANLQATPVGSNQVQLSWDPPMHPELNTYLVRYSAVAPASPPVEIRVPHPITDYKVQHLRANTEYAFQVVAVSPRGHDGVPSRAVPARTGVSDQVLRFGDDAEDSVKTADAVPNPPRDVTITVLNETSAKVTWDEPAEKSGPVTGYFVDIYDIEDNHDFNKTPNRKTTALREIIVTDLKPSTKYAVRVSAYNNKGDGNGSKYKTFKTMSLKPMPPTGIRCDILKSQSDSDNLDNKSLEVRVMWEPPSNLKDEARIFMLKYKAIDDASFIEVPIQNATHYDLSDLKHGNTYEFRVSALYDGQYSEEGRNKITMPIGIPEAAPNLRYEYSANDHLLEFIWDEIAADFRNGEITRYQYVLQIDNEDSTKGEATERKFPIKGVAPAKKYAFKVRAGTMKGFGPWTAMLRPDLKQQHDFLVPILELTAMSTTRAGVRWQPLTDERVRGYRIQYTREMSAHGWSSESVWNKSVDHVFVGNLQAGATYQFCVQVLIVDGKISECASRKDLQLKPSRVVENLRCDLVEEKAATCKWDYFGSTRAEFEVSYHLNKTYRMHDGTFRQVAYVSPIDNVTKHEIKIPALRFYTVYTVLVSVVADETIYLPHSFRITTPIRPPPEFDPPKVVESTRKDVTLKLVAAADENGPVLSYWLVIAHLNYSRNVTDHIENAQLLHSADLYVAGALTQDELWGTLTDQHFVLGTGTFFNCTFGYPFLNKPLSPNLRYKAFLRAFVGNPKLVGDTRAEKTYRSSAWSSEFKLVTPPLSNAVAGSMVWILAPLAVLLVACVVIGGICVFLFTMRRRRLLTAKRGSTAKVSLSALNGGCGVNETSKLLLSHEYSAPMPPPINGHVKPYETVPLPSRTMSGLMPIDGAAAAMDDVADQRRARRSAHYPVPPTSNAVGASAQTGTGAGGVHRMPVAVLEFAQHVDRLKQDDNLLFSREYESIETDQHFTWEHSNKDVNKPKNRYANVIAYDHSRVVQSQLDGNASDYINANYIDGYRKPKAYIATQGPLPETFGDFWRMVWEQASATIVMLTKLEERTRIKCDQYWPTRAAQTYGVVQVSAKETLEFAHYTLRIFDVLKIGSQEPREVRQLQFTAWPDHGVPEHPTPFLTFLKRAQALNPTDAGPIVVHCSAGVGRTGAFIVVDCMLERLRHETTLDVCGCVAALRSQRNYMVQTEEQYVFAHEAVLDAVQSGCTEVPVAKLCAHIQKLSAANTAADNMTSMELEFRILASLHFACSYSAASLACNKHKNRLVNIVPYDSTRVRLGASFADTDNPCPLQPGLDYINASFVDGYRRRRTYMAAQAPLHNTVDDFWRMLWQHNSTIVVMLTKLREMGREKCYQYWPSDRGERYGNLIVEPIAEYNMPQYILREFKLADATTGQSRTVRHFQYTEWPDQGVPKSGEFFIEFIGQVHKTKEQFGQEGPITVHCSAGVGRTGVFICLSIVLERMRFEGVVDIFTTVKLLRTQRPNMVQSEDQYQFCYRAALEYLGSFDHYAMQLTD